MEKSLDSISDAIFHGDLGSFRSRIKRRQDTWKKFVEKANIIEFKSEAQDIEEKNEESVAEDGGLESD